MRQVKRIAALLLCLALLLSVMPAAVLADTGTTNPFTGKTYVVLGGSETENSSYSANVGDNTMCDIRFRDVNGGAYTAAKIVCTTDPMPTGITVQKFSDTDDYVQLKLDGTQTAGTYTLDFTVDGMATQFTAVVIDGGSSGGSQGGSQGGTPVLEYSTDNKGSWLAAPVSPDAILISYGSTVYIRMKIDGTVQTNITAAKQGGAGDVVYGACDSADNTIALTAGMANGSCNLQITDPASNKFAVVPVFVSGVSVPGDVASVYADATVKQVAPGVAASFENVSGTLTESDAGFSLSGATLTFAATGTAGIYKAVTSDGKTYAVAVMPALESTAETTILAQSDSTTVRPTDSVLYSGGSDGVYAVTYGVNPVTGQGAYSTIPAQMMTFGSTQYGTVPLYFYRVSSNAIVSMEDYSFTLSGAADLFEAEFVTLSEGGPKVLQLRIKDNAFPDSFGCVVTLSIYDEEGNRICTCTPAREGGSSHSKFGFSNYSAKLEANDTAGFMANTFVSVYLGQGINSNVIQGADNSTWYLAKKTGDPAQYDYVLYDDIRIETLRIRSTNPDVAVVTGYVSKSASGKNAIGFTLDVKDTAAGFAEILVDFTDKGGNPVNFRSVVNCLAAPATSTEWPVTNESEFKAAYKNAADMDTIVMAAGTYAMDILHDRAVTIKAAEGAQVIITGDPDSNAGDPIITLGLANPAEISGVILDGGNNRVGIWQNSCNAYASNITIRNCTIALKGGNSGSMPVVIYAANVVFENNARAITTDGNRTVSVSDCTFVGNTETVVITPATGSTYKVQQNKFFGNGSDFTLGGDCNEYVVLTQNYYASDVAGATPRKPVTTYSGAASYAFYYAPWYTDKSMTTLTADLAGARPVSGVLEVPVDRTITDVSAFDSALFTDMKTSQAGVTVSLPVTENLGTADAPDIKLTTVWGFDNGTLTEAPGAMDLKVTDTLSASAQAVVDAAGIDSAKVAQYVNFSHDGALPGTATVKVLKTDDTSLSTGLKLYYINEATGQIEAAEITAVTTETIGTETYYVLSVAHCSEYIIATAIATDNGSGDGTGDGSGSGDGTGSGDGSGSGTGSTASGTTSGNASVSGTASGSAGADTNSSAEGSANQLISAVEVEEKFENASTSQVGFSVEQKPLVSPKAFEVLSQYPGATMVLQADGYSWSFAADDITNPSAITGASFDTTISLTSPNQAQVEQLVQDGAQVVNVYFSHHGQLPGTATIRLHVGKQFAGQTMYLHYADLDADTLVYLADVVVDDSGNAEFPIDHCSDYVLLDYKHEAPADNGEAAPEDTESTPDADTPADSTAPDADADADASKPTQADEAAGGALPVIGIAAAVLAIAGIAAAVILGKKRK